MRSNHYFHGLDRTFLQAYKKSYWDYTRLLDLYDSWAKPSPDEDSLLWLKAVEKAGMWILLSILGQF